MYSGGMDETAWRLCYVEPLGREASSKAQLRAPTGEVQNSPGYRTA